MINNKKGLNITHAQGIGVQLWISALMQQHFYATILLWILSSNKTDSYLYNISHTYQPMDFSVWMIIASTSSIATN